MKHLEIPIKKLYDDKEIQLPKLQTSLSAAADIHAYLDTSITLKPLQRALIGSGFAIALPKGFEAQIRPRSGLALKHGITVLNAPGTIDADYRGEVGVILINLGQEDFTIEHGDRIAQICIAPTYPWIWQQQEALEQTDRDTQGFGSTGI